MLTRREFIRTAALFALAPHVFAEGEKGIWVNDVHSQLNRTRVRELLRPRTRDELAEIVRSASRKGLPISHSQLAAGIVIGHTLSGLLEGLAISHGRSS